MVRKHANEQCVEHDYHVVQRNGITNVTQITSNNYYKNRIKQTKKIKSPNLLICEIFDLSLPHSHPSSTPEVGAFL